MDRKIVKYNPAFLSDEELIAGFVVRLTEYELITEVVRENTTESNQHVLVIGPRGSGKTTLVRRVAAEIRRDKTLQKHWYPIIFGEESYMVSTPGEFWLEAIFHLGFQNKDKKLKKLYEELNEERDEERLRQKALAQLLDFADREDKRLILIVENLHQLLGDQLNDSDAWTLRQTLLHESKIMILATSVSTFEEVENEGKAMFELFKKYKLNALEDEQCKTLWESITGKETQVDRIRPIKILTGGNPRLVTIISKFGADLSFQTLMEDLLKLVDENTEYFKGHLDNLSAQERKVYLSLAEIWDPATAKQVSDQARLAVNKTSTILGRLEEKGAVSIVGQEGRKKFYQIAERMYNIYYLMRRRGAVSGRVKATVRFIAGFYDQKGIVSILKAIAAEACSAKMSHKDLHCAAFNELFLKINDQLLRDQLIFEMPPDFIALPEVQKMLHETKAPIVKYDTEIQKMILKITNYVIEGVLSSDISKLEEAKSMLYEIQEKIPKTNRIIGIEAIIEDGLGNYEKAKELYEKYLKDFQDDELTLYKYAMLLKNKLSEYEKAGEVFLKLIDIWDDKEKLLIAYYELADIYVENSSYENALSVCNKAVERFPDEAIPYGMRAIVYQIQDRHNEAIMDFQKSKEFLQFIKVYNNIIYSLVCVGRYNEAIEETKCLLDDYEYVKERTDGTTDLIILLASEGFTGELITIIEKSKTSGLLEPLLVGLKMYLGQDIKVAEEIKEVAKDVVKRINEVKAEKEEND